LIQLPLPSPRVRQLQSLQWTVASPTCEYAACAHLRRPIWRCDNEVGQIEANQLSEPFGPILNSGSNQFMGSNNIATGNPNCRDQKTIQFDVLEKGR
jgi:hypothetical protein